MQPQQRRLRRPTWTVLQLQLQLRLRLRPAPLAWAQDEWQLGARDRPKSNFGPSRAFVSPMRRDGAGQPASQAQRANQPLLYPEGSRAIYRGTLGPAVQLPAGAAAAGPFARRPFGRATPGGGGTPLAVGRAPGPISGWPRGNLSNTAAVVVAAAADEANLRPANDVQSSYRAARRVRARAAENL